jgi:tetratricopeptide (TPR) repeat protein
MKKNVLIAVIVVLVAVLIGIVYVVRKPYGTSVAVSGIEVSADEVNDLIRSGTKKQNSGDYKGAEADWLAAKEKSPANLVPYNNLGNLYHYYLKDFPKAEQNLLKVIELDPSYISGYRNLLDLYRYSYQQNTTKAVDILQKGLKENPKNIDLYVLLANYYQEKGDMKNARLNYNLALEEARIKGDPNVVRSIEIYMKALK